jgi:hypothetical protein
MGDLHPQECAHAGRKEKGARKRLLIYRSNLLQRAAVVHFDEQIGKRIKPFLLSGSRQNVSDIAEFVASDSTEGLQRIMIYGVDIAGSMNLGHFLSPS